MHNPRCNNTYARCLRGYNKHAELVAVAGGSRTSDFATEYAIDAERDVDSLLSRNDIDAVIIATPHQVLAEHSVAAARKGKHVLVENPMATSVADCDAMIGTCREAGVWLSVIKSLRYRYRTSSMQFERIGPLHHGGRWKGCCGDGGSDSTLFFNRIFGPFRTEMSQSKSSIQAAPLSRWAEKVLLAKGVRPADATRVVEVLVTANLRAVDSHGVFTCLRPYLERIDQGKINLEPEMKILRDQGATLLLDGDLAFGQVAAWEAMELAMERAPVHGIGMVSVTRSTHLGMASFYPLMAVQRGMIGLTMTNCKAAAVPTFGTDPRLGTNPLSLAAPAGKHPPFELDMATTVVSGGKVYTSHLAGKQLPEGWVVDEKGAPLTDSTIASQKGRYLPLGGDPEHGSHKGYGLGLMVDILCGILSGGNIGPAMQAGENYHLVAAIDIKAFQDPSAFKAMMDTLIDSMHDTPTVHGQERVFVPGEMEHEAVQERSLNGIPIPPAVLPWLEQASRQANFPPPWDLAEQGSQEK